MLKPEVKFQELTETYEDGQIIFEEGDTGRDLYIVQSGIVKIIKKTNSGTIEIAEFKKGDFFGDMSLLQSMPRYAGAVASGKTKLLVLKPAGFLLKIRRDPTFAFEMLQSMSLRIKISNDRILELVKQFQLPMDEVQKVMRALSDKV